MATTKKPIKSVKRTTTKSKSMKPIAKKVAQAKKDRHTTAKKMDNNKSSPMVKVVVDRVALPKGGKLFVKAIKRPTTKKQIRKTVASKHK